jgi:hypothetical protein
MSKISTLHEINDLLQHKIHRLGRRQAKDRRDAKAVATLLLEAKWEVEKMKRNIRRLVQVHS